MDVCDRKLMKLLGQIEKSLIFYAQAPHKKNINTGEYFIQSGPLAVDRGRAAKKALNTIHCYRKENK